MKVFLTAGLLLVPFLWCSSESTAGEAKPTMLKAPFTQEEAFAAQKEWSQVLGTPVVVTNSIGMEFRKS
jgi:hypothetical protein